MTFSIKKTIIKLLLFFFFGDNLGEKIKTINAYFNIIKGVNLENKEKLFLIENKMFNKQKDIGIHIYYLKDYNDKPLVFIDCVGYGTTKNKEQDDNIMEAFSYLFQNIIKHINLVCFMIKESYGRLNLFYHYIIGCVTSLFSEHILKNFIFLITNIEKDFIKQQPQMSMTLYNDIYYDYIKDKMDKKWFYSINSESILNNEINELSKYSYEQLIELNKEKVYNSKKIPTREFLDIIKSRLDIKSQVRNIISLFQNLKSENSQISNFDSNINYYENKIKEINSKIHSKNYQKKFISFSLVDYEKELKDLEKEHENKMFDLNNQVEVKKIKELETTSWQSHTICTSCCQNCHDYCDCVGGFVKRCKVFPIFGNICEECGHSKSYHNLHINKHYVFKTLEEKIPNYDKKSEEDNIYNKKKSEINSKINNKKYEKEKIGKEIDDLNKEKNSLEITKKYYINEKNRRNILMKQLNKDISNRISNLIDISNKIENKALNKYQFEIENEYIDFLIEEIRKNDKNSNTIEKLKKRKQINVVYQELTSNYFYLFGFKYGTV